MKLVTKMQWGGKQATAETLFPGPFKGLSVHWEGPKMGSFSHDKCAGKVRGIQNFHMAPKPKGRGWADIAYNWLVCPHGYVFIGRGPRNRSAANGTDSGNDRWLAVCYLGGVGDPFTVEAQNAILELKQSIEAPAMNCHSDHKPTECPGDTIRKWVKSDPKLPSKPPPVKPTPAPEVKMFYVYTGTDGLDWGTDLVTRQPFETQERKAAWIKLVQGITGTKVERIVLTAAEQELLHPVGVETINEPAPAPAEPQFEDFREDPS